MKLLDAERLLTRVGQVMWMSLRKRAVVMTFRESQLEHEAIEIVWELKREIRRELRK